MNSNSPGNGAVVKVNGDRVRDLLLQVAEIFALGSDTTQSFGIIPPCHQPTRLFVALYLQGDFFHLPELIIS